MPTRENGAGRVAATQRDPRPRRPQRGGGDSRSSGPDPVPYPDVLPPVTTLQRSRLGTGIAVLGVVAVLLAAAGLPAPVRAPVVLVAALLVPGFPIIARMAVDLPTMLALTVVSSLALEAGGALVMVKADAWHPHAYGLLLAVWGVGGTFYTLTHVRHLEARHLQ